MPRTYTQEAREKALGLHLRWNGDTKRVAEAMRAGGYPDFSHQTAARWAAELNWDASLRAHQEQLARSRALTDEQEQLRELVEARRALHARLRACGYDDVDLLRTYRDLCAQCTAMFERLNAGQGNYKAFVFSWEILMDLLPGISAPATAALLECEARIFEAVKQRGENQT